MNKIRTQIVINTIETYSNLLAYLKLAESGESIGDIYIDFPLMKSTCAYGIWYTEEGLKYKHLASFQAINLPYNNLYLNYYGLLDLLSKKPSKLNLIFNSKETVSYKLKVKNSIHNIIENCQLFLTNLKKFELELVKLQEKNESNSTILKVEDKDILESYMINSKTTNEIDFETISASNDIIKENNLNKISIPESNKIFLSKLDENTNSKSNDLLDLIRMNRNLKLDN